LTWTELGQDRSGHTPNSQFEYALQLDKCAHSKLKLANGIGKIQGIKSHSGDIVITHKIEKVEAFSDNFSALLNKEVMSKFDFLLLGGNAKISLILRIYENTK
jgi:hypothetical protein